jgi:hypothetical protein
MKTLKNDEVDAEVCANIDDARRQIGAFIGAIYNRRRLRSAPGDKPPVEFEAGLRPVAPAPNQDEAPSLEPPVKPQAQFNNSLQNPRRRCSELRY